MNKLFFLFYLVAASGIVASGIENRITQVTVYPSMAMVQREAKVRLRPGENELEIAHLSAMMADESVFAKIVDNKNAQLDEVKVERWFLEKPEEGVVKKLEDQITDVEKEDKRLENEIKALQSQEKFLTSIQMATAEKASQQIMLGRINATAWTTTLNFLGSNLNKVYADISALEFNRQELKAKKEALQKQLLQVKTAKPREEKSILMSIKANEATTAQIVVAYLIGDVTWWPTYEVRALPLDGKIEVVYSGHVRQKTGEDWQNIALSLSTAIPARGAEAPELMPWDLRIWEPRPVVYRQTQAAPMALKVAEAPEAQYDMAAGAEPSLAEAKGTSVVFNITGSRDIPSSEEDTKVLILRQQFPAKMSYFTIPKLNPYAYLKGAFTNESDYPFLPGEAMIYVDGDFVGKSHLKNLAPAEELELSLGIDDGIKIKRELVKKFERNKGLLTKKKELEYDYKITLENYKARTLTLQVEDQLPRPLHESISVAEIILAPETADWDREKMKLTWQIELKPKEKKEITLHFTVSFPREAHIGGLE